jgi:hypothetical protein
MNIRGIVITGAAALAACGVLGIAPPAAQASSTVAPTWTVAPGGSITAAAGKTILEDTTTSTAVECSSKGAGSLKSGSGLAGRRIGKITSLAFNSCAGGGLTVTTTASPTNPWPLNAQSYNGTAGVTSGTITNLMFTFSNSSCSFTVAGTTATTTGTVKVRYTNSTHTLKVNPTGGTLHFWNVSCPGVTINDGDIATLTETYKVTPGQTITSP